MKNQKSGERQELASATISAEISIPMTWPSLPANFAAGSATIPVPTTSFRAQHDVFTDIEVDIQDNRKLAPCAKASTSRKADPFLLSLRIDFSSNLGWHFGDGLVRIRLNMLTTEGTSTAHSVGHKCPAQDQKPFVQYLRPWQLCDTCAMLAKGQRGVLG